MAEKERLDILLVNKNLAPSRELAKAFIMAGKVYVNGNKEEKAGTKIDITSNITVNNVQIKYVSRGGYKLEKAIQQFDISLQDKICIDIGASTGGFTDCMLQNGAKKVFSVDVGYGQFDWKLRNNPKVVCMEKTNIRYVTHEHIAEYLDFASIDVSFISLTKILLVTKELLNTNGAVVCLIKPQFEAGRENVGKKGVVKNKNVHIDVIMKILNFSLSINFNILGLNYSPIKGPEGNIEYLAYLHKSIKGFSIEEAEKLTIDIVEASHIELDKKAV